MELARVRQQGLGDGNVGVKVPVEVRVGMPAAAETATETAAEGAGRQMSGRLEMAAGKTGATASADAAYAAATAVGDAAGAADACAVTRAVDAADATVAAAGDAADAVAHAAAAVAGGVWQTQGRRTSARRADGESGCAGAANARPQSPPRSLTFPPPPRSSPAFPAPSSGAQRRQSGAKYGEVPAKCFGCAEGLLSPLGAQDMFCTPECRDAWRELSGFPRDAPCSISGPGWGDKVG